MANDGVVYRPHLVQALLDHNTQKKILIDPQPIRKLPFQYSNFEYVKQAMQKVLRPGGTAAAIGSGLSYTMGGKTGTAQVVQIKQGARYNAAALKLQLRDHAWFIAFAPVEKPQIAIAVILENNGWGATAAPLARQRWMQESLTAIIRRLFHHCCVLIVLKPVNRLNHENGI